MAMKIEYKKTVMNGKQEVTLYVVQTEKVAMPIPVLEEEQVIYGETRWLYTIYDRGVYLKNKTDIETVVKNYVEDEDFYYEGYCGAWFYTT